METVSVQVINPRVGATYCKRNWVQIGYDGLAIQVKACFLGDTKFYLTNVVNINGYNCTI